VRREAVRRGAGRRRGEAAYRLGQATPAAPPRRDPSAQPPFKAVVPRAKDRFKTCVPLVGLDLAAGGFAPGALDPSVTWVELPKPRPPQRPRTLRKGMFVARVVGRSMDPGIPDGSWCLFAADPAGDLRGRTLLVQHRGIHDADTGTSYTVKRLERAEGGATRLVPDNDAYAAIELREHDAADLRVVAELLEVLSP
jgi:phage repressor protein C with HTH and peptisase S24 domain